MSKLIKNVPIKVPQTPNYIFVGTQLYPIAEFTDEELTDIGEIWTKELIKKAQLRRKRSTK